MIQFYFLSILMNILAGLILIYGSNLKISAEQSSKVEGIDGDDFGEDDLESSVSNGEENSISKKNAFLDDLTFRLVVGILSVLVGIVKLFSVTQNDVAFVGDLLPALAGIISGLALLVDFFEQKSENSLVLPDFLDALFSSGRKYIGIFCILVGVLHFVFPRVLFL